MTTDTRPAPIRRSPTRAWVVAAFTLVFAVGGGIGVTAATPSDTTAVPEGTGTTGDDHLPHETEHGQGPVPGAVGSVLRDAVPGMYTPDSVVAELEPSGAVALHTARPCDQLTEILLAGDWQRTQQLAVPPEAESMLALGGLRPMVLLRQGDAHAMLTTRESSSGCRAVVTVAPDEPVRIDATSASVEAGYAHTTRCLRSGSSLFASAVVGGDGISTVLQMVIDGDGQERTARLDDSSDSMLAIGPTGVLDALQAALVAELAGDGEASSPVAVVDGSASSGRAEVVDDGHIVRGTVELTGGDWYDETTGASGQLAVTFPFVCPTVTTIS